MIVGTRVARYASPVATEQSCMSLQRFGVTKLNGGSVPAATSLWKFPLAALPIGTSLAWHWVGLKPAKTGSGDSLDERTGFVLAYSGGPFLGLIGVLLALAISPQSAPGDDAGCQPG